MYYKVGWFYSYSERSYTEYYVKGTVGQANAYLEEKLNESPDWMKQQVEESDKFVHPIEMKIFEIDELNKLRRLDAQKEGFDDFCEAHQIPYNNECPECGEILKR